MFRRARLKFDTFWYNFSWDYFVLFLNGPAAKFSVFVPLLGYAVIFNDYVVEQVSFHSITGELRTTFFLDASWRVRLIFFGLSFLALANITYRVFRPNVIKLGETVEDFSKYILTYAPANTLRRLHMEIQQSGYDPLTPEGKYYDDEWDLFWREAVWIRAGKNEFKREDLANNPIGYEGVNFSDAKKRHESLLLSIIRETYFREGRKRRVFLCFSIIVATVGYILLLIPSIDLFLRVVEVSIISLIAASKPI